jgi:restriction endonuclease-like protein
MWRVLDACTSSDALLMNVFCYPDVFKDGRFRARVPLANGKFDRTEVEMRLGELLIEAKLTESDFQRAPKALLAAYRDFCEVFSPEELPQTVHDYRSYQLIRNVLAAHTTNCAFCVLTDARRPELIGTGRTTPGLQSISVARAGEGPAEWVAEFLEVKYGIE